MSESSPAINLHKWLHQATSSLQQAGVTSARLDALVLLADELGTNKAWVLAHPDEALSPQQLTRLADKLTRRAQRMPMAYIRGHQEFYGREFVVTPQVLIPRPESEALVDSLLTLPRTAHDTLLDVGTGSGALAITTKLERPDLHVMATDVSADALKVARQNATNLKADVSFAIRDLLHGVAAHSLTYIVANLPYVARSWERSAETNFEPALALFADDDGLALITTLIAQATQALSPKGWLLLEADPRQHTRIAELAKQHGFAVTASQGFAIVLHRS
ncbi:MAG TPA: peptide chain release factor N(5)-glutamine methyltransferase [Candidatus Saccharimonadales bacterium]|nr:peptide chain release factor N(5)-glutamine methyltransferase [Candidatus Saccharimonadales bacterium]